MLNKSIEQVNMKIKRWIGVALIQLLAITGSAQYIAETGFADYLLNYPVPRTTITATLQELGDNPDQAVMDAFKLPKIQRDQILKAFMDKVKANMEAANKNKALLARYSTEEQKMMRSFRSIMSMYDEEGQLSSFYLLMEERPLVSTGKLSWSKLPGPLSAAGQAYYQQLLKIETKLSWPVFFKEAGEKDMTKHMFYIDPEIQALNIRLEQDRAKIPMKKIRVFEGMDATTEIQDPVKMMKLLQDDNERRLRYFQNKHNGLYAWWKQQEIVVRACATEMDALLETTGFGNKLQPADRALLPVIGDIQERIWNALVKLNSITRTIVTNAQTAEASRKMTAESVEMYNKMISPGN